MVKWIKIVTDIFDDEKILFIELLPEGDTILIIWFKLLMLAGKINNGGVLLFNNTMPYTDEMLATIFRRKITIVRLALKTFHDFGMVEIVDNVVYISNWKKHQNLDSLENRNKYMKDYMKKYRENIRQITEESVNSSVSVNSKLNVNKTDIELELERELDKEEYKELKQKNSIDKKFADDSIEMRIALYFHSLILDNDPNFRKPNFQSWCKDIDGLLRIDKRSIDDVQDVIVFATENKFWRSNVLSAKKLREKFSTLYMQMKEGR